MSQTKTIALYSNFLLTSCKVEESINKLLNMLNESK